MVLAWSEVLHVVFFLDGDFEKTFSVLWVIESERPSMFWRAARKTQILSIFKNSHHRLTKESIKARAQWGSMLEQWRWGSTRSAESGGREVKT